VLAVSVKDVRAAQEAASPHVAFELELSVREAGIEILGSLLRCQVRIEAARRTYTDAEARRLMELFGPRHQWTRSLGSMLWADVSLSVGGFSGSTRVDLLAPVSYELGLATAKYFQAVSGDIPLAIAFSGMVFHSGAGAAFRVATIPWSTRCELDLKSSVHRELIARHYPDAATLSLSNEVYDRLCSYRTQLGLTSWDRVLDHLLGSASGGGSA
jgi:hypothetical protein